MSERIAITGMAINTPLSDSLDGFLTALLAGESAVTGWKAFETDGIYSKVGADLSAYDIKAGVAALAGDLDDTRHRRLRKLTRSAPWSTKHSLLLGARAFIDSGLNEGASETFDDMGVVVAGHNLGNYYSEQNRVEFQDEPDFIDGLFALHALDTDHAGSVSELIQARGPAYTVGAACASGNTAMRCAVDEIRYHDARYVMLVGAVLQFAPIDVHAMALMGAISFQSFNDEPHRASRPYDADREGFVPAHGGGALLLENWDHAVARGARIYAEVMGVEATSDGNHLPQPSADGQSRAMQRVLKKTGVAPQQISYVNAHATSTPLGDVTELESIRRVFGSHASALKINATKSMLGHCCWSAPIVETVATVLQMRAGQLHPSINVDNLDPRVDVDICAGGPVAHVPEYVMKNAFGFGGINSVSILRNHVV